MILNIKFINTNNDSNNAEIIHKTDDIFLSKIEFTGNRQNGTKQIYQPNNYETVNEKKSELICDNINIVNVNNTPNNNRRSHKKTGRYRKNK